MRRVPFGPYFLARTVIPTPRTLVLGLIVALALVAVWIAAPPTRGEVRVPAPPAPPTGAAVGRNAAVGMTGCLAAACHGAPAAGALSGRFPDPVWPASGTCWVATDPHSGAYDALVRQTTRRGGPNAQQIMVKLGGTAAAEDARCLACHTNPSLADPGRTEDAHVLALRREGVSCEACHGNAAWWLRPHTTGDLSALASLAEVGDRAAVCLGCHVGAPADESRGYPVRDMNHDMIAAGHPRLNFDFAEYLRRLPKHWREKHDDPDSPVREWLVGRIAHAEAACRLLADRAKRAERDDERTPWPEFAEFDCLACHHQIPQPWRNEPSPGHTPGALRWQIIWPVTDPDAAVKAFDPIKPLLVVMSDRKSAAPGRVIPVADEAAGKLAEARAVAASLPRAQLGEWIADCFPRATGGRADWDAAGQMLHGAAATGRGKFLPLPATRDDFAAAFEAVRRRDWDDFRPPFDRLLSAMPK